MTKYNFGYKKLRSKHLDIDLGALADLQEGLSSLTEGELDLFAKQQLAKQSNEFRKRCVNRTQKKTGLLKSSWKMTNIQKTGDGYERTIYNNALNTQGQPYASFVEYGHWARDHKTWVTGHFMQSKTVFEMEKEIPEEINKELATFLEKRLEV